MWQPAAILFPDVELWATTYLRAVLATRSEDYAQDVFVSNKVPTTRRARMVILRRDGGEITGTRDNARLSARVWAGTDQDANDLARLVGALLWAAPDGDPVLDVTQASGPTPVADESEQPLKYLTFEIATRGEGVNT